MDGGGARFGDLPWRARLQALTAACTAVLLVASLTAGVVLERDAGADEVEPSDLLVMPDPQRDGSVGGAAQTVADDVQTAAAVDGQEQEASDEPVAEADSAGDEVEGVTDDQVTDVGDPPAEAVGASDDEAAAQTSEPAHAEVAAPAEPEPQGEPEPQAEPESQPEPQPEPEPAPTAEREPEPEPQPEPQHSHQPSDSERIFAREYPNHAAARQTDDPATRHWAVLVGVNRYQGRTSNTLGSVADVMTLRSVLLDHGWREDHILVLTDEHATHDRIVRAIEWLARSTDERSTVVFSFSGHMRHANGVTALWPTDNRYLWAGDFGRMMGSVRAGKLWASLQGCHAEGLRAPGLEGPNRIITYSSKLAEKSYEDPEVGHSVQGWFMFNEGFKQGHGDLNGDGRISVQEAWNWATPRANTRTAGRQTPVVSDGMDRPFFLHID